MDRGASLPMPHDVRYGRIYAMTYTIVLNRCKYGRCNVASDFGINENRQPDYFLVCHQFCATN